jgi:hypothetical protein
MLYGVVRTVVQSTTSKVVVPNKVHDKLNPRLQIDNETVKKNHPSFLITYWASIQYPQYTKDARALIGPPARHILKLTDLVSNHV